MAETAADPGRALNSLLIIEVGERSVSGVLTDVVANRYRLIASAGDWSTASDGNQVGAAARMLGALEDASGRRLLREGGITIPESPEGRGCDGVVLAAGRGLRVAWLADSEPSASALLDALDPLNAHVESVLAAEDLKGVHVGLIGQVANFIRTRRPDALVVWVGSAPTLSEGMVALARALGVTHGLVSGGLPPTVVTGNSANRGAFLGALRRGGSRASDQIEPRLNETEQGGLRDTLAKVWRDRYVSTPIAHALAGWSINQAAPRLNGVCRACQALATWRASPVWAVDVGDRDVAVVRANASGFSVAVRQWEDLDAGSSKSDLAEWIRRPWLVASERPAIDRQRALLSQVIAQVAADVKIDDRSEPLPGMVIGRGVGLVHRLPVADAASALCLGIGVTGSVPVAFDRHSLLAGAGALLDSRPQVAADLIYDSLDFIALVVVGRLSNGVDATAAAVEIAANAGEKHVTVSPSTGLVTVLAAEEWANAEVTVHPSQGVDVGSGSGRRQQVLLGDGEFGAVVAFGEGQGGRRWTRGQSARKRLAGILGRTP